MKNFNACSICLYLAILALLQTQLVYGADENFYAALKARYFPASYGAFYTVKKTDRIDDSLFIRKYLYFEPGVYELDNPVIIDVKDALFIHGLDRTSVIFAPKNPGQPLFLVKGGKYINFTNIRLSGFNNGGTNLLAGNDTDILLELQDCFIERGTVEISGPGLFRMQGVYMTGHGVIASQVVLNHADAALTILGGNITHSGIERDDDRTRYSHVWAKQGLLQITGLGVQRSRGLADFRIDAPAPGGRAHQIVNVRSEGNNGLMAGGSAFVYVPVSRQAVNVDIVNSAGSWHLSGKNASVYAVYGAAGRLRLVGNSSTRGAGAFVDDRGATAPVFEFVGNILSSKEAMRGAWLGNATILENVYADRNALDRFISYPHYKRLPQAGSTGKTFLGDFSITVPQALSRPAMTRALPSFINAKDYGARGDGITDDTAAIRRALAADKHVFFPEGRYRLHEPVLFNVAGTNDHGMGGWLAGAGSGKTTLVNTQGGGAFRSEGLAYATVSGISFASTPVKTDTGPAVLDLEYIQGVGHATQSNSFYDLRISGGYKGIAIGDISPVQCSENIFVATYIENSAIAISVGGYNALANIFHGLSVTNALHVAGHFGERVGGTWSIIDGSFSGIKEEIFDLKAASDGIWLFDTLDLADGTLISARNNAAPLSLFFNRSHLRNTRFGFSSAGGLIFNHSRLENLKTEISGHMAENYIVFNASEVSGHTSKAGNGARFLQFQDLTQ